MTQPVPAEAPVVIELEDTFDDGSLEMNEAGNGFRVALALQDKLDSIAVGQTNIPYTPDVTLDAAVHKDCAIGTLTGSCAITWSNPAAGRQGTVAVRQDGAGNHVVWLVPPSGWTLMRDSALADLDASQVANSITSYTWSFVSVGGANVLLCSKVVAA